MPVPKKHGTSGKKRRRRSHMALKKQNLPLCAHCGKPKQQHRVCPYCGFYGNTEVVNVIAKQLKKQNKKKGQK